MIPYKIHFTFLNKKEKMPKAFKACYERAKQFHPEWDIKIFNEDDAQNILAKSFPSLLPIYNSYSHTVQKSDILRPLLVYLFGGFYMDLDMYCLKSLDELCNRDLVLAKEFLLTSDEVFRRKAEHKLMIANYMFGSIPEHPFWLAFIRDCLPLSSAHIRHEYDIIKTTGPQLLTNVYHKQKKKFQNITILENIDRQCLISGHPEIACHFGNFAAHLHTGTWRWRGKKPVLPARTLPSAKEYNAALRSIDKQIKESSYHKEKAVVLIKAQSNMGKTPFNLKHLYTKMSDLCKVVKKMQNEENVVTISIGHAARYRDKVFNHNTNALYTAPTKENLEEFEAQFINQYYHVCFVPDNCCKSILLKNGIQIPIYVIDLGFKRPRREFGSGDDDEKYVAFTVASPLPSNEEDLNNLIIACQRIKKSKIPDMILKLLLVHPADISSVVNKISRYPWIKLHNLFANHDRTLLGVHCYIFLDPATHLSFGPRESLYEGTPAIISNHEVFDNLCNSGFYSVIEVKKNNKTTKIKELERCIADMFDNYHHYNTLAIKGSTWIEDKWTLDQTVLEISKTLKRSLTN